jgi:hypothetical protein
MIDLTLDACIAAGRPLGTQRHMTSSHTDCTRTQKVGHERLTEPDANKFMSPRMRGVGACVPVTCRTIGCVASRPFCTDRATCSADTQWPRADMQEMQDAVKAGLVKLAGSADEAGGDGVEGAFSPMLDDIAALSHTEGPTSERIKALDEPKVCTVGFLLKRTSSIYVGIRHAVAYWHHLADQVMLPTDLEGNGPEMNADTDADPDELEGSAEARNDADLFTADLRAQSIDSAPHLGCSRHDQCARSGVGTFKHASTRH